MNDLARIGMDAVSIAGGIKLATEPIPYCFVAGTLVATSEGQLAIEQIKPGDMVLAENPETGEVEYKEVLETYENETEELIHVHVDGEDIVTTPSHPFYVNKFGWTRAAQLRAGDVLVLSNGEYVVVEFIQHEILEEPIKVYNFEVEDFHTYFVGENSVLVHNGCGDEGDVKRMNVSSAGHHVPSIRKSKGRSMQLSRGNKSRPTIHFTSNDPGYDHWRLHEAEKATVGKRQGDFIGSNEELLDAYKRAYDPLDDIRVDVKSPDGKTVLGTSVTPSDAVDLIRDWLIENDLM